MEKKDYLYGPRVFHLLNDVKLLNSKKISFWRKILNTCTTGILLIFNLLLIATETIDIRNCYDLPSFAARINPICFHTVGAFKWIYGIATVNESENLIEIMKHCHKFVRANNRKILDAAYFEKKLLTIGEQMSIFAGGWLIICIGGVVQWCLNPVFYDFYIDITNARAINSTTYRHLPYPGTFPWIVDNFSKYIGTFSFQLFGGIGCAVGHSTFDILYTTLLACANLHLEILRDTLVDNEKIQFNSRFLDEFIRLLFWPMFIICFDTTIAVCLVSLEAATMKIDYSIECVMKLLSMMEYWTAINFNLFIYCYFATRIEELGLAIADAAYASNWEQSITIFDGHRDAETRKKITRMIHICVMRSQKSILITGALFYVLSLKTFKSIVGLAISNALILRQVSE